MTDLSLTLQTGTLYASNDASTFAGTGGPFGFSPFTSQFGGVVSSAGIAGEPFSDTVYGVAAGDEVIFVIALQNMSGGLAAYDLGLRATLPAGFAAPADGTNLTVTDGTGTDLVFSGNLFGTGIRLSGPVARYDANSGLNVVLVTYTLAAGTSLPGPYASIVSTAAITHSATGTGGTDQGIAATATTTVVTAAPVPLVQAETSAAAVAKGQTIAFDISLALPAGTMQDVRLDEVLPGGSASLAIVSTAVTGIGSGLQLSSPVVGKDGSVQFGTITSNGDPAHDTITLRVVVQANGTASGTALLQTVLSSASSGTGTGRWSATVGSSVGVVVPPAPPGIAGVWAAQQGTPGTVVHPLGGLVLSDNAPASNATLAVTLRDGSLGRLGGGPAAAFDTAGATFVLSGALAVLQAAARALVFTPSRTGTEQFNVTLIDPGGGLAQDAGTALTIAGSASDVVVVAPGGFLAVTDLHGTTALQGQGATLQADHVSGVPVIIGFGANDRIVLPGTGTALSYVPGAGGGTLSVGGTVLTLSGSYDPSWFQAAAGSGGTVILTFKADPLFDGAFYLARYPDVAATGIDPFQHYLVYGWREGRIPDALFSTSYYLAHSPDVAAAGLNPLLHYEQYGWREGRDPSALFSERDYLAVYPDVSTAGLNPLLHYIQYGQAEGRISFAASTLALDPLVDPAFYYAANPDIRAAGLDANTQYLTTGWQQGRNPDAFFDSNYYLTQNPDVRANGLNPLQHFETYGWKEGRQPSLLFDDAKYLAAYPDVKAAGLDPLLHFLLTRQAEGRQSFLTGGTATADPLVNAAFYDAQLGATLIPTGTAGAQQAAYSYDATGWRSGLNPSAFFDTAYYLSHNPDVAAAHIDPLLHFELWGWKESRNPSARFDDGKYLAANPDVRAAGINPLLHYVVNGALEGRPAFAV